MIRAILITMILAVAAPAMATQNAVPGLYAVADVADDDTLNVRERPNANAAILGELGPGARNVEVVDLSDEADWGLVNIDGRSGWVSMAFLRPMPNEFQGRFPSPATCFGTEPFWSVEIDTKEVSFARAGEQTMTFTAGNRTTAEGRRDRWSLRAFDEGRSLTTVIGTDLCTDGMSDQTFGLSGDVILSTDDSHVLLSGCCSLAR
ncbi:COG3650 family protein [Palleronia abyssalis]|uniref:SH3b domain-containing protein n=1 Tax=Palleronia abyssalis TaxID=1501240 RepID=A0A2R8BT11_9RHOB|nr:SH3 domain-containing protein [Palleronia abyssalis]SPJ23226.1 hypothetical protein PAA8504_01032 [Palleronia abyssalis]